MRGGQAELCAENTRRVALLQRNSPDSEVTVSEPSLFSFLEFLCFLPVHAAR